MQKTKNNKKQKTTNSTKYKTEVLAVVSYACMHI